MTRIRNEPINVLGARVVSWLFVLSIIIFMTGCTNNDAAKHVFKEIMSHTGDNTSPNWRSIEPGATTEIEFKKLVSVNADTFEDLRQSEIRPEGIRYVWYDPEFQFFIGADFHENIATRLDLGLSGRLLLEDILNIAGHPTAYITAPITEEFIAIRFIYEEIGVVIAFFVKFDPSKVASFTRNCKFDLSESTPVSSINIYFVEHGNLDSMITAPTMATVFTIPEEIPEPWIGIDDALMLTAGGIYLEDGTKIDCLNP